MILGYHECADACGNLVIPAQCRRVVNVFGVGKAVFELYDSDDAVVHDTDEFGENAFADSRAALDFKRTYTLGLDENLVGQGRRTHDAP